CCSGTYKNNYQLCCGIKEYGFQGLHNNELAHYRIFFVKNGSIFFVCIVLLMFPAHSVGRGAFFLVT
ncbi:MAG: hypothetical protein Q4D56_10130, partial [Bacteroides sp.]|nr:hypothetical protein [Bacteroides sp.]